MENKSIASPDTRIETPSGIAARAPDMGNISHAKMPCTNQKFSQLHCFTLRMGTYELDCPKLPTAIINKPISVFMACYRLEVTSRSYFSTSAIYSSPTGTPFCKQK